MRTRSALKMRFFSSLQLWIVQRVVLVMFLPFRLVGGESYRVEKTSASASDDDGERVVNGRNVVPENKYPSIFRFGHGGNGCGGALIAPSWVVTAAHCLKNKQAQHDAYLVGGDYNLTDVSGKEKYFLVKGFHVHENSSFVNNKSRAGDYDIALLEIYPPAEESENIKFSILAGADYELEVDTNLWVVGWGSTKEKTPSYPILQEGDVRVVDVGWCAEVYLKLKESKNKVNTERSICASKELKDACQGDSGGPLYRIEESGRQVLVGLVNFGKGCARPGYPGVYAKISAYSGWIERISGVGSKEHAHKDCD